MPHWCCWYTTGASRSGAVRKVSAVGDKRFLTLADVAEVLNISSSQTYALVRSGELPARVRRLLVQLGATLGRFDLEGQLQKDTSEFIKNYQN